MSTAFPSATLMTRSAPNCLPIARRLSRVPVRMTGLAPSAFATATASSPIGPGPITTTLSPATRPPNSVRPYIEVPAVTTSGVNFHADAFSDFELVDTWSERGNRTHIFMTGREILVEGQTAPNARRRAAVNDLKVSCTDRNGSDADQNFRAPWSRRWFVPQKKLVRVAQHPRFHLLRNKKFG